MSDVKYRVVDAAGASHWARATVERGDVLEWRFVEIAGKRVRFKMECPERAAVAIAAGYRDIAVVEVLEATQTTRAEIADALAGAMMREDELVAERSNGATPSGEVAFQVVTGVATHNVAVRHEGFYWHAECGGVRGPAAVRASAAVTRFAAECHMGIVEVLSPGQKTRAELEADVARFVGEAANQVARTVWTAVGDDPDAAPDGCPDDVAVGVEARVLQLVRDLAALQAILVGRAVAPTDAEIVELHAAGGSWFVAGNHGRVVTHTMREARETRDYLAAHRMAATWWALDAKSCLRAWPVAA